MGTCNARFYTRSLIGGNSCIWFISIVVLGLSVASVNYDVDTWLPFAYKPVLETRKVATAALVISTVSLHLAALGWITLGYRREWQIKAYMLGNGVASLLQLAIGIGVLVIQKRAWPYFQLISLHLCYDRFTHQRSRRVRSVEVINTTEESSLESWFPTDLPPTERPTNNNKMGQVKNAFFDSLRPLPTRPGPAVPSDCLPVDLLTASGSLLIIAAFISVYLAFVSYRLWCHQRDEVSVSRRNTFSGQPEENLQEIPPMSYGHPEKPLRNDQKTSQDLRVETQRDDL